MTLVENKVRSARLHTGERREVRVASEMECGKRGGRNGILIYVVLCNVSV